MHPRPLALVFALVAFVRHIALAEFPVSTVEIDVAPNTRSTPAIASHGDGFLAVWTDERSRTSRVIGTRLAADGTPLDETGIVIGRGRAPVVAWNGEDYFVAWECPTNDQRLICGANVGRDGTVHRSIPGSIAEGDDPDLAWNGAHYLLTTTSAKFSSHISGVFLDRRGAGIASPIFVQGRNARIASNGEGFFILRRGYGTGVSGFAIDGGGRLLNGGGISAGSVSSHDVASNGADYYAVWDEGMGRIFGRAIHGNGSLGGDPQLIAEGNPISVLPSLEWNGRAYVVVFTASTRSGDFSDGRGESGDIRGAIVGEEGIFPVDDSTGHQSTSALAWGRSGGVTIWMEDRGTSTASLFPSRRLLGRLLGSTGAPLTDRRVLSRSVTEQTSPRAADGNRANLAVWVETREGDLLQRIYAGRFTGDGELLDGAGIVLHESRSDQRAPAVSFNGGSFLVVWCETDRTFRKSAIYAARIAEDGTRLDPAAVLVSDDAQDDPVAVGWDGQNHLVAWTSRSTAIATARVSATGVVLDVQREISTGYGNRNPAIVWTGSYYYVVWNTRAPFVCPITCGPFELFQVHGAGVAYDGYALSAPSILSEPAVSAPAAVWTGKEVVTAWFGMEGLTVNRIDAAREPVDGRGRAIVRAGSPDPPSMLWNGSEIVIAWATNHAPAFSSDIVSLRLLPDLRPVSPVARPWAATENGELAPQLFFTGSRLFAIYQRFASEEPFQSMSRVFIREAPPPRRRAVQR